MRHHRAVSTLHLDPAVLRATAATVEALLPLLGAPGLDPVTLAALARVPDGTELVAEHDRLAAAVGRTGHELGELVANLAAVAAEVEAAERAAVAAVGAADR